SSDDDFWGGTLHRTGDRSGEKILEAIQMMWIEEAE
ncbi:MAG: Fe-S cluster assembly protein IscX, partial [Kineosporiaceae bacterium]